MKASKLITKDQRKNEYGDYVLIKNNAKKTVKGFNLTFEQFLTRTLPLNRSILKGVIIKRKIALIVRKRKQKLKRGYLKT